MPLSSDPIDPDGPERRCRELLDEFTRGWFNGTDQTIQGRVRPFPACTVAFNQAKPDGTKPIIHYTFADARTGTDWGQAAGVDGLYVSRPLLLHVTVRVQPQGRTLNRADDEAGRIADLLTLLIQTPSLRKPLAEKGILQARVLRPPVAQSYPGFQSRFMVLSCKLRYFIAS